MKKCFVIFSAAVMLVTVSGMPAFGAAALPPDDSLLWQVYDGFPGPDLNIDLWVINDQDNTTITVNNGLTISPATLGTLILDMCPTLSLSSADRFAMKIPFQITDSSGTVYFALDIEQQVEQGQDSKDVHIAWVAGAGIVTGTDQPVFHSGLGADANMAYTVVTQGWLGYTYDGLEFSGYYNDGTGWTELWTSNPQWSGQLLLHLTGEGEMTATISQVLFASLPPSAIPIPGTLFIFGSGILGLIGVKRRLRQ